MGPVLVLDLDARRGQGHVLLDGGEVTHVELLVPADLGFVGVYFELRSISFPI